ncbi:MAG TPA: flagellar export chaperone FliS [Acidimicrobiales bacterium]|nr:flagellar export chaperone FliS [Acidimicrobiales bacterium]
MTELVQADELRRRYLKEAVETASASVRLTMLWDRVQLDLSRAEAGFESRDLKAVNDGLVHAQEILLALRDTMRVDAWEGAPRLVALYDHLHQELVRANLEKDRERLTDAAVLVVQLADAWRRAAAAEETRGESRDESFRDVNDEPRADKSLAREPTGALG